MLFSLASLVVTPIALAAQRHFEHEADRFGLEITRDNYAAATAFVTLQQENLGVPRPGRLYKWWRASHPTLGDRIDFSNDYRPWESNQPLVYADLFKKPLEARESDAAALRRGQRRVDRDMPAPPRVSSPQDDSRAAESGTSCRG